MSSAQQQFSSPLPDEFELFKALQDLLTQQERSLDEIKLVKEAFEYARQKHDGQLRADGGNYITHPVEVATILADVPVDTHTVAAAILHDVLEDTDATADEIKTRFGSQFDAYFICFRLSGATIG